jgi:hypothetical protein
MVTSVHQQGTDGYMSLLNSTDAVPVLECKEYSR